MPNSNEKVLTAKTALEEVLGDNITKYYSNLKFWFRHKWTKEEFDIESRKLLTADKMHFHNQFLIAILNKIDSFSAPPPATIPTHIPVSNGGQHRSSHQNGHNSNHKSRKRKRSRLNSENLAFEPFDIFEFLQEDNMHNIRPPIGSDLTNIQQLPTQRYCVQELFLPEAGFVLGRFLIGAWEVGIANVEDRVAEYVAIAIQELLKNLISAIIVKRKHYRVTGEGSYYYDVGTALKDPSLRNTVTRQKIDDGPLEMDKEVTLPNCIRRPHEETTFLSACEDVYPQRSNLITLRDAQRAFNDRNIISSHSVYAVNMERLTQMMH